MYSGLGAYYLKNGQPATVLYVGDVMGFNVPGYSQVWLDQLQNGAPQFSGPFNLPMASYVLQPRDVGSFQATVYELKAGQKGKLIGTDSIQVQAAPSQTIQQTFAPPTIQQIPAPGYTNPSTTPGGQAILSTGVATPSLPATGSTSIYYQPGPAVLPAESAGTTDAAPVDGFPTALLVVAGLGLLFLFSGRGRR